jgi:hypothetical protein
MNSNSDETKLQSLGTYILIASSMLPGMIVGGIFADWNVLPTWLWFVVAMVGSGVGGYLAAPQGKQFAGLGGGAIAGAGVVAAIWGYWLLRSQWGNKFYKAEILVPFAIGILPGLAYYLLATRNVDSAIADD